MRHRKRKHEIKITYDQNFELNSGGVSFPLCLSKQCENKEVLKWSEQTTTNRTLIVCFLTMCLCNLAGTACPIKLSQFSRVLFRYL